MFPAFALQSSNMLCLSAQILESDQGLNPGSAAENFVTLGKSLNCVSHGFPTCKTQIMLPVL